MGGLKKYYSERSTWRVSSQENMRFKPASKLISFAPNAAVLDVGWTKQATIAFGETCGFKVNQTSGTSFYLPNPVNVILTRSTVCDFKKL